MVVSDILAAFVSPTTDYELYEDIEIASLLSKLNDAQIQGVTLAEQGDFFEGFATSFKKQLNRRL